jgi:hypothetical protein
MQVESPTHHNRELLITLTAIVFITVVYVFVVLQTKDLPTARGLFGHSIGVLGFLLMLMTETLYSLRKRSLIARWGRLSTWLEIHIITGIVGPTMVLLHTSWKFNGLAGVLMLLTIIVVASGFVGRYIYTAIPRTADGAEMETAEIEIMIGELEAKITAIQAVKGESDASTKAISRHLNHLTRRKRVLSSQIDSLATTRRLMALWHTIHIPIGMLVFTTAFFHIIAAIYYATLIR